MINRHIVVIPFIIFYLYEGKIMAQIAPNIVDSLGLKQGKWEEYKIPYDIITQNIEIKIPKVKADYYIWTKDKDRKYFPIIQGVGEYKDGLKTGVWIEYYSDGKIKSQIEYKNGIPSGICRMYWLNGFLKMECIIGAENNFTMTIYNEDGTILMEKEAIKAEVIKAIYEN